MKKIAFIFTLCVLISSTACVRVDREKEVRITGRAIQIDESDYPKVRGEFGLVEVQRVSDAAAALGPSLPMALGVKARPGADCLYLRGCDGAFGYVLIVKDAGGFRIARNQEDLKRFFAPIENEKEALGYAVISTGLEPRYEFNLGKKLRTFVWKFRTTSSIRKDGGYEVNLFFTRICGCGPHPFSMVVLRVGKDGSLARIETVKLYEDPDQDGLCVD